MRCRQAQRWISLWLDEQLRPEQWEQLQQHLDACPSCRQLAQRWVRVRKALRRYPSVAPRADFDARVWHALSRRRETSWTPSPLRRLVASAALGAVVAISLLAAMWWQTPRASGSSPLWWIGAREVMEWDHMLGMPERGNEQWQDGSSLRSWLPFCLWWRW